MLAHDLARNLGDVQLPVRVLDDLVRLEGISAAARPGSAATRASCEAQQDALCDLARLQGQQRAAHVAVRRRRCGARASGACIGARWLRAVAPTRAANSAGSVIFSFSATCCSRSQISASDGDATRTGSVRERTASSTREMLLHSMISRHAPATPASPQRADPGVARQGAQRARTRSAPEYFSIVRRSAC